MHFLASLTRRGFPYSQKQVRTIACDYMKANKLKGWEKYEDRESLGYRWGLKFFQRTQTLNASKKPIPLSINRAMCTNIHTVRKFYNDLQAIREEHNIPDENIWNVDECGVVDIPEIQKVVGVKGETTYMTVSGEKGDRTSLLTFISSGGEACPPMILQKGINLQESWMANKPEDVYLRCTESGYINKEKFTEYCDCFLDWLEQKGRLDKPHLILMDGHTAHSKNYDAISAFHEANCHVLLIPAHSSHKLQPLDKNPFAALKFYWNKYLEEYNRKNAGRKLPKAEFFTVFNLAWFKAMTTRNILLGFERTGIHPFNPDKVKEEDLQTALPFLGTCCSIHACLSCS